MTKVFVAPSVTLMTEEAPQRSTPCGGVQRLALDRAHRRAVALVAPRPAAVSTVDQQTPRWSFERWCTTCVDCCGDCGARARTAAAIFDARTVQSTPESGAAAGWMRQAAARPQGAHRGGHLGHVLALLVTPAHEQERAQVRSCRASARGDRRDGRGGLRGPRLHRKRPPRQPRSTASVWRWSSCPRPSAASSSCPAGGWGNAVLPGWRASGGWPGL